VAALTLDQRGRLAATLATVDAATVAYKGWERLLPQVRQGLDRNR
jgi:hypothetical protein